MLESGNQCIYVYLHNPITIVALEASAQGFVLLETQKSSEVSVTKRLPLQGQR